jgi:hypothetical protein
MEKNIFVTRNYSSEEAKSDPVVYMAKLIGLESELPFIKLNKDRVLPVLTGLVVYRQLNHIDKQKVLRTAQELGNRKFFGKVQTLCSQVIANAYLNPWSLSNVELRSFFNFNKSVSDFLGTWFITVDGKLEVGFIAGAIYEISSSGSSRFISNLAGKPLTESALSKLKLSSKASKIGAKAFFVLVILASVIKKFSEQDIKKAKEELRIRGLLKAGDL